MAPIPLKPQLSLEGLDRRITALEADRRERDTNSAKTKDIEKNEYAAMLEAVKAQLEPRFDTSEKVNATQLALLRAAEIRDREAEVRDRASEAERIRRAARDEAVAEQERREEIARATKSADRRHLLKVIAAITLIVGPILAMATAAVLSHLGVASPPPSAVHEESHH